MIPNAPMITTGSGNPHRAVLLASPAAPKNFRPPGLWKMRPRFAPLDSATAALAVLCLGLGVLAAASLPPFTAVAHVTTKNFNPFSNSFKEVHSHAIFQSSNGWWHLRVTSLSAPGKDLFLDCRTIAGGIREFVGPGTSATALPIAYPLNRPTGVLGLWLALYPNPKLPLIDAHRMRRFLDAPVYLPELINDPRNEGTYGLKYLAPARSFVSELNLTNNGFCLQFMGYVGPYPLPFDRGFHELKYAVLAVTNVGGFTFPLRATCQRLDRNLSPQSAADVRVWSRDEISVLQLDFSAAGFQEAYPRPPTLYAQDYRFPNLPPDRPVAYLSLRTTAGSPRWLPS